MKNYLYKFNVWGLILGMSLFMVSCADDEDDSQYYQINQRDWTVADYITNSSNNAAGNAKYTTLYKALVKANLLGALEGDLTLLAPTNAAFDAAGIVVENTSVEVLTDVLNYHVLSGTVERESISGAVATAQGSTFNAAGNCINGVATLGSADINLGTGKVYELNTVLLPPTGNIVSTLSANDDFSLLVAAVTKAGLASALSGTTRFTVFAPTNAAFEAAGITADFIDTATPEDLAAVLEFHVLAGETYSCAIQAGRVATIAGALADTKGIDISTADGVSINGADVISADIAATNGVIHQIDAVISPASTIEELINVSNVGFTAYYSSFRFFEILDKSDVSFDLNGSTIVFVPTTLALDSYLAGLGTSVAGLTVEECNDIVRTHIFTSTYGELVDGTVVESDNGAKFLFTSDSGGDFLNLKGDPYGTPTFDATFVANLAPLGGGLARLGGAFVDRTAYNGTITTVNAVLTTLTENTIVDQLVANGNYTALVAAAIKTGLAETLANDRYIVFAPNDAAFAAIGLDAATIDALDETDDAETIAEIEAILLNHVATSILTLDGVLDTGDITTVGGKVITFEEVGGQIVIADNTVDTADNVVLSGGNTLAANGFVHGSLSAVLN